MHTEKDAADKWCPLARSTGTAALRYVNQTQPQHQRCIGSNCMAWRWADPPIAQAQAAKEYYPVNRRGFCGQFGPPDLILKIDDGRVEFVR